MSSIKLQSFEDFAAASKATAEAKIQEEQKAARTESAYKFETLLSEFGVTSVKDLNEEDRGKFFAKLGASEVSESLAIIEEGTRSQVGKIKKNGKITSVYMHYDGYPDHMLPTIKKGYKDGKAVDVLLKKGGGSGLETDPSKINFYGDKATLAGDIKHLSKYISHADYNGGAEFIYLFDERDGEWYMVDVYGNQELVPAFESLFINEAFKPSKGNLRDAKKVAKFLEGFFTQHSALSSSNSFLGACRYLLSEALGDANFHSYKDPVSKALGGKISTIMVDIDNLGGMSIPVGKKAIMGLLDEHYSGLANAAGWSGIGIVEGMALFLDGFGYAQQAQKIADAFELIWANESVMNEGNAFLAARAKAIEEDAAEFEFNGKTYPVIKEGIEEVNEGLHPKLKKAQKAVDKGETVYGENVRFPGRFKILELGDMFAKVDYEDGTEPMEMASMNIRIDSLQFESTVNESEVNEGLHPKLKKAQKAVDKGETVYGENVRFPGRFKILELGDMFAKVDYEDGTEPMEMASMNIRIDSLQFESTVNESEVKSDEDFKEYAFSVLGKAFGDKFDEEKAQEVVDGLLSKHGDDYGAAVGALTSSLG